ncbi:MAG: MaoC family dehydratase [Gammaproteobacteria bacterium PRO9]|nr:MaoC family dehydratase [Gammaproteobacteria bacterium PRO9]
MAGRYYEEFQVGQVITHDIHRTVTETDNLLLTTLTHNPAALHLDAEYCRGTEFGRILVNSCFTLSLMVGISVHDTTHRTAIANLGWEEIRFPLPVFIGDTLHVTTEVKALRESRSRPDAGIVTLVHRTWNQRNEEVANCTRVTLLLRKPQP